jgi:hypothetical protein
MSNYDVIVSGALGEHCTGALVFTDPQAAQ